jgi:hypothetical protein
MSPILFPRVKILKNNVTGFLTHMMPQSDDSYLYEIMGDDGKTYVVNSSEFIEIGEEYEPERKG